MKGLNYKIKEVLVYVFQPRVIIFLVALFNFIWFFSKSSSIHHFSDSPAKISFCLYCPWYWYWSLTNLPSLSLIAAICLIAIRWKGYLASIIISGYQIIEGINWISNNSGFLSGFSQRLEVILESDLINLLNFWELLDIQYVLALVIFVTAFACLIKDIINAKYKSTPIP